MKLRLIENRVDDEYNKFYSDIDRETFDALIKLDPKTVVRDGEIINIGFGAKQLLIAKWRGGDKTILDKGEEITNAFNKFYANMKSYPAQYKNLAAYASVDDFIKYVNGEEVEAQELVKENPIDIIYNKYYKDIDREDFNKIIALDPKTSEDKIGEVARDLLLANYKKGEKNFIDDDQLKDAINVFYDDFNKLSKENQQLKNYLSIEDFKTKILAGDETDFEKSLKNNQTIDPDTHRPVSEDAVIVGSTRNYTIIWQRSHRAAVAVSGGWNSNKGMHWCTGMEPTTGCENDHYYRDYATGGKNIVAFLKKGAERGSENRDQNFQICINSSGTITEFLNGWDSTPKYSNDSKDDAFRDFLTANPEIIQAIQGKDPFKNCGAIVKAQQLKQYLHEPFVLDGEDKIFALQTNSALIYAISEVIVKIKKIPAFAFAGSPSLRKITLEPGVEVIGAAAFVNCLNISTIVLPEGLQKIEYKAFSGCTGLKGSVRLPDSVTEIQTYAFAGTHIKLAINKERKEKLKVDINDADWYKSHAKGILIR